MRVIAGLLMLALRFWPRIWSSENERLGLKSCTPIGYGIICLSDLFCVAAQILLVTLPLYLIFLAVNGRFAANSWWLLLLPFAYCILGVAYHARSMESR